MNSLDKYWDKIHLKYNSIYDGWLDKYLDLTKKDGLIIELGCGRAYCSKYLLNYGYENIIACDFSKEVLNIVKKEKTQINTMLFDMSNGLPFEDDSVSVIIADLCLHYFESSKTKYIINEIKRVLKNNGYLIGRVNSLDEKINISNNAYEVEKNFFYDGDIYKRFFDNEELMELFKDFNIYNLEKEVMNRYDKPKKVWKFCVKKQEN